MIMIFLCDLLCRQDHAKIMLTQKWLVGNNRLSEGSLTTDHCLCVTYYSEILSNFLNIFLIEYKSIVL